METEEGEIKEKKTTIQAKGKIVASMGEAEKRSGIFSLIHAFYSAYKRFAAIFLLVLGLFAGTGFYYFSTHRNVSSPSMAQTQQEKKERKDVSLRPNGVDAGDVKIFTPMSVYEPEEEPAKEDQLLPEAVKEQEMNADAAFEKKLMEQKVPFVPDCGNNYIVLIEKNMEGNLDVVYKEAANFLISKNFPIKEKRIEIINVRNIEELAMAFKNGSINSPYCIEGKLFDPETIGYDLIEFPVFLPDGVDPQGYDTQFIIKEQLESAKEKMGKSYIYLRPKLYKAASVKTETGNDEDFNAAVEKYWKYYLQAKRTAEGKLQKKE